MMRISIPYFCLFSTLALGGCASSSHNPKDPFESYNRGMYQINDAVDKAVVKPLAKGYDAVVPPPGRMMLSNFFSNLNDVIVAVNDLLQFKVVQAVSDTGRIVVNTTVGLFGIADVASAVGLKKHNEDFGQTLGYWGIGSGPYVVLPLFGPSSVRDSVGLYADSRTGVIRKVNNVPARNEAIAVNLLGQRASLLSDEKVLDEAAIDRYSFIRDAYLQHRQNEVYDGNPPRQKYDDDEEDSKPDKSSSSSGAGNVPPSVVEAASVTASVVAKSLAASSPDAATITASTEAQQPSVRHIWVTQGEDLH